MLNMKKISLRFLILPFLILSFDVAHAKSKHVDHDQAVDADLVDYTSDKPADVVDAVADQHDVVPNYAAKPLEEKYSFDGMEGSNDWRLIYQDKQTQYFQNDLTVNDGIQLVEAWIKTIEPTKKTSVVNYYQVLCKDQTFKVLEQYQSKDDQNYKLVKKVDLYRQTQPLSQAGERLPVFKKLCKEREDFAKAWGIQ